MNQYKAIFLGTVDPQSDFAKLKRAVNTQKVSHSVFRWTSLTKCEVHSRRWQAQCRFNADAFCPPINQARILTMSVKTGESPNIVTNNPPLTLLATTM
jgi:hypothetical protein